MCGIVGLCRRREPVLAAELDAMNRTIVHRGPDGAGDHLDGTIGIAMRRLSIIDLEGGWQPIANETNDVFVVHNGEIYNFQELRTELESLGHQFRTQSDTEVLVHAYEQWGGWDFANHLRGMFAVAIWDRREQTLWLVRDRLGIKPLYFLRAEDGFAFGSELKAVEASPWGPRLQIREEALAEYFTFGAAAPERSFLAGVEQLRPGHALRLRMPTLDVQTRAYWQLTFPAERGPQDEQEALEALSAHLERAVRSHLVADVPVGAFLSGGVDSSAMVALASKNVDRLHTFSIGFAERSHNELPYAREVAERYGTAHHECIVTPSAVETVDQLVSHFDEPFADASAIPTWIVSQLAAQHVKVVLSGDGGDELFAGYSRLERFYRRRYLDGIPRSLRRLVSQGASRLPALAPGRYFLEYAAGSPAERYLSELCHFPLGLQAALLRPEFHPRALGVAHPCAQRAMTFTEPSDDLLSQCLHHDTTHYLPMDILVKVDRMTMAHSLEARPPLLDHELVEFAAALPNHFKYRSGAQKYLLRKAMEPLVPRRLLERPKSGFSVPLSKWFSGPLRDYFADCVLTEGRCLTYLQPSAIASLVEENRMGRRDHGLKLWAILMLELWLRRRHSATPRIAQAV